MDIGYYKELFAKIIQQIKDWWIRIRPILRKNASTFLFIICFIIFGLYCQLSFPDDYKDIIPQQYQSHDPINLTKSIKDFNKMKFKTYNNTLACKCNDIQITKNQIIYCINEKSDIIEIDTKIKKIQKQTNTIYEIPNGITYGLKLSQDQKKLYFVNSQLGLCEFDIEKEKIRPLVKQYQGSQLISLNAIQIHPENPNLIYFTQSSTRIPLQRFNIDIILNNPFGRVFQFNKQTLKLSLIADKLYFPNGVVYQKYKGQDTLLVAQTSRHRIIRIYISGGMRGVTNVAIDKLQIFPDNIKLNEKGQIWVGSLGTRDQINQYSDANSWTRRFYSRLPTKLFSMYSNTDKFGGALIKFSQNNFKYKVKYYLWGQLRNYRYASTIYERNNKVYISSFENKGILSIAKLNKQFKQLQPYVKGKKSPWLLKDKKYQ